MNRTVTTRRGASSKLWLMAMVGISTLLVAADADHTLTVVVGGLRSDKGHVGCLLFHGPDGFPGDHAKAKGSTWCAIEKDAASCKFSPVEAGEYAVACFHDENNNNKLDLGLFNIPSEGVAVSKDAKGFMGPPKYADAKFDFSGTSTQIDVHVHY